MRKEHLHVSIDRKIFGELLNVWKIEQERALKNGETVSKSAVAELILKMGIREYYKTTTSQNHLKTKRPFHSKLPP